MKVRRYDTHHKQDIPFYNLVKENEQVSFEQNQHIPTSLFEPLLQAMILKMVKSGIYTNNFCPLYNGRFIF